MDIIIVIILIIILGSAITYIVRAKKDGVKCVGCPMSKTCSSSHNESSSCSCKTTKSSNNVYDELLDFDKK